jgi:hypothetical protein
VATAILSPQDFNKNEIQNARIQNLGSAPGTPVLGQIYFDTAGSVNLFKYWNGTAWIAVALNSQQITGLADPSGAQHAATQNYVVTRTINSLAVPTANFSMGGFKITSLGTPTVSTDAATMAYVDTQVESARQGINYKPPVRVAATTNVTVATPGATVNGVTMVSGDRMLLTNQTTGSENGIYVWNGAASAATRAVDADVFGEVQDGTQVYVREGTDAEKVYRQTAVITSFTGQTWGIAAAGGSYVAGGGLTDSANTFAVGAGTGITVNADDVAINTAVVVRKWTDLIGDGTTTAIVNTHGLGTRAVQVTVRRATTPWDEVLVDNAATTTNTVTTTFAVAPTTDQFEILVTA